ncbi:mechanosensitive ion channel family protein [bacterium]|nr:mechanosensitive ion channel family protein [bacterium]
MIEYLESLIPADALLPSVARALIIIVLAGVIYLLSRIAMKITHKIIIKSKITWDDYMIKRKVISSLVPLPALLFLYQFTNYFEHSGAILAKFVSALVIVVLLIFFGNLLNAMNDIYKTLEISRGKSIKGFIQVFMIILYILGFLIIVSIFINTNPLVLISGLGAMTAVLMLIFKDTILSFVASVRITTSDIIQIGDWLEVPKFGADGDVIDISLYNVQIQNWDKTITNIPTYKLIDDSFKNWRGMQEAGGRRIMRKILLDISSVKFCDDEMIAKFEEINYLKDYITQKKKELLEYNTKHKVDDSVVVNGRRMTNLGTFRAYIASYLKHHPYIHKDLIFLIRQLEPEKDGIPIQIYVFVNQTAWVKYEDIQSDIFDHLLAVVPEFGLRVFQNPSSYNFEKIAENLKRI